MNKILMLFVFICFPLLGSAQNIEGFLCREGNKTVRLEFENNVSGLELGKPTKLKVFVEHIDLKKSSITGRGIRPLGNSRPDEFFLCEVTVVMDAVDDGMFKIIFSYTPTDGGGRNACTFMVPVKP